MSVIGGDGLTLLEQFLDQEHFGRSNLSQPTGAPIEDCQLSVDRAGFLILFRLAVLLQLILRSHVEVASLPPERTRIDLQVPSRALNVMDRHTSISAGF